MRFSDFVCVSAIRAELKAGDKPSAIQELVASLVAAEAVPAAQQEGIVKAILKREELGSTGIGRGVAVPHAKHASVDRLIGTIGVSSNGIDFNSLDGENVHLFFLLVSPPDRPRDHLLALESISRQLRDDAFCRCLKNAKSVQDIQTLLNEADQTQAGA
ncbi:MAG: system mannose-specific component [Planctomycetota bacterium]|jgi:PTS system fructose-specific IIA component/PTS system nitrogen regulatory IIA component